MGNGGIVSAPEGRKMVRSYAPPGLDLKLTQNAPGLRAHGWRRGLSSCAPPGLKTPLFAEWLPMLIAFTLVVMLIVAYYHWHEGLFTATSLLVCVLLAGLATFNFWEPLANLVESFVDRSFVQGYEDFVC